MAQIATGIGQGYVPSWEVYEGVREMIQNGQDAQLQQKAPLHVEYDDAEQALRVKNLGCTLSNAALVLGKTTKADDERCAGHFGEGLKLGLLALCRAGIAVKVWTGPELWTVSFTPSADYGGEKVLTITTRAIPVSRQRREVVVEMRNIAREDWQRWRNNFLLLRPRLYAVSTESGRLLLDPVDLGRVYVKGIFVMTLPKGARYGYDMDVPTDRDRRVIESDELEKGMRRVLAAAGDKDPHVAGRLYDALVGETPEAESVYGAGHIFSEKVRTLLADRFRMEHGNDALPVGSEERAAEARKYGLKPVVLAAAAASTVASVLGVDVHDEIQKAARRPMQEFDLEELDAPERLNFLRARDLLDRALVRLHKTPIQTLVVALPSDAVPGLYNKDENLCQVSRSHLATQEKALRALTGLAVQRQDDWDRGCYQSEREALVMVTMVTMHLEATLEQEEPATALEPGEEVPAAAEEPEEGPEEGPEEEPEEEPENEPEQPTVAQRSLWSVHPALNGSSPQVNP